MRKIVHLILFMACLPAILWANDDKYLVGAVPEVDGKVIFSKEFDLPGVDQNSIYEHVHNWLDEKMKAKGSKSRIVFAEKEKGHIATYIEEFIVFSDNAISLDRSVLNCNIVVLCKPERCEIRVERIRYNYENKAYTAEEMISDKVALNKKKTAIVRGCRKFRVSTIDYVDDIFESARISFGIKDENAKPTLLGLFCIYPNL